MRKYLLGIFAILAAVAFSAFTSIEKKIADRKDGLYWYSSTSGLPFPNNPQVNPPSGCSEEGSNCALGFTDPEDDPINNSGAAVETTSEDTK
jgi:hypothetical protein